MNRSLESFDGVTHFWCPILGQPINFGYCRKANEGLPCSRVLVCYESHFDVAGFLEQNYSDEQRQVFLAPPPGKIQRIKDALERSKGEDDASK
jgi:hypothetical protein